MKRQRLIQALEVALEYIGYHADYRPGWNGNRHDAEQLVRSVLGEVKAIEQREGVLVPVEPPQLKLATLLE